MAQYSATQPSTSLARLTWPRGWLGIILTAGFMLLSPAAKAAPGLLGGTVTAGPGEEVVIPVDFDADGSAVALQFDLVVDAGVASPLEVTAGHALVDHVPDFEWVAPGRLRTVITSATRTPLAAGRLMALRLQVSARAAAGDYPLLIESVVIADAQAGSRPPSPVANPILRVEGPVPPPPHPTPPGAGTVPVPGLTAPMTGMLMVLVMGLAWVFMRRGVQGVVLSVTVGCLLFSSVLRAQVIPGDANGDGRVDATDIPFIVAQIQLREPAPGEPDCNEDAVVDVLDTVCVVANVNQPPTLAPINNRTAVVDTLFQLAAVGDDPDLPGDTLAYTLDIAPPGMTIDPVTGLMGWVPGPTQLGTHDITVRVTDQHGLFATTSFTITVSATAPENQPPTLQAIGNRAGAAESTFGLQLFATDPDTDDTLVFSLPVAPAGMSVHPSVGRLDWLPGTGATGPHAVTARVTDQAGAWDEQSFVVEIGAPIPARNTNRPPRLTVPGDTTIMVGQALSAVIATASDPDAGDALAFSLAAAPAGMTIDASSGEIDWTPAPGQVAAHDVIVQVTDRAGAVARDGFVVTAFLQNRPPVANDDVYQVRIGVPARFDAAGVLLNDNDPDADPISAALVSGSALGQLSLAPDGSFEYLLEAPDRSTPVDLEVLCEVDPGVSGFGDNSSVAVGDVDADGIVEIVGASWITGRTYVDDLYIVNAETCEVERVTDGSVEEQGGLSQNTQVGLIDIDGDGDLEIIGARDRYPFDQGGNFDYEHLMAFHHDGSLAWAGDGGSEDVPLLAGSNGIHRTGPVFSDIDADGTAEILVGFSDGFNRTTYSGVVVYDLQGRLKWAYLGDQVHSGHGGNKLVAVADLDLDGTMEILIHNQVIDHNGQLEFTLNIEPFTGQPNTGWLSLAVANFDDDAWPEILARDLRWHYLFEHDGTVAWQFEVPNTANSELVVADLDADGEVEFAYEWCDDLCYLRAWETDGSPMWTHEGLTDYHGSWFTRGNTPTAFDANNDGAMDIVYKSWHQRDGGDSGDLIIADGRDGSILEAVPAGNYTRIDTYVPIVDVDRDGDAELIVSFDTGLSQEMVVWTGSADHPLPAAPMARTQWQHHEAYTRDDGSIISNPVPHWLQPGLNGFNMVSRRPDPLVGTTDSFTYVANDGELDSAPATVTLEVMPAGNPPAFLTEPDALASRGFPYTYTPIVVDPDLGDTVTFSLSAGPDGMTLDPATGAIAWAPDVAGAYPVSILALDSIGFAAAQQWLLEVGDPLTVPDVTGLAEAAALAALDDGDLVPGRSRRQADADVAAGAVISQDPPAGSVAQFGGAVDLVISLGPAPDDADNDGDNYSPNTGDCDDTDPTIHPGAADTGGDGIDQDCDGIDGSQPIEAIVVAPARRVLLDGESAPLAAHAMFADGSAQPISALAEWASDNTAVAVVSANGRVTATGAGNATISASRDGVQGTMATTVVARVGGDDLAPTAAIDSPVENDFVTEPVNVMGTAYDLNLVRYRLELAPAGELGFTLLAEGTNPVQGGVLGELDPTRLLNGLYTLRLTVLDAGGNSTLVESMVQVDGLLKVGQFSVSYTDVTLPASGLPLELTRNYDNRDKSRGDFGVAWTLGIRSARLHCADPLGEGWHVLKSGLAYQLLQTRPHSCVVDIPGRRLEVFDFTPANSQSPIVPFSLLQANFTARPGTGTQGRLENPDGNHLLIAETQPGPVTLLDDTRLDTFTPEQLVYTHPDGTRLVFAGGELVEMGDRAGNTITFSAGGVVHSSGRALVFERDAAGRVTRVTDPLGNSQQYRYSPAGDLVSHIDPLGHVTRYHYNQHHDLVRIEDPLQRPVVRNEYDEHGRLVSSTEADGRVTHFSYTDEGRRQVMSDTEGGRVVTVSDDDGNVTAIEDALGGQVFQTFDADGNRLSRTDENGLTTTWTWDARGNRLSETNPAGETRTWAYDANNNVIRETDPQGRVTTYAYSAAGLPIRRTNALGEVEFSLTYDRHGNLASRTDALGNTWAFGYNGFGDRTSEVDARGHQSSFQYDANGRMTRMTDRAGQVTRYRYDVAGRLVEEIDPLGRTSTYEYDAAGQLTRVTDAAGASREDHYDAEGNRVESRDALGGVTRWTFDATGLETGMTSPGGQVTEYTYDVLDRRTRVRTPGGQDVDVDYDAAGRIIRQANALGSAFELDWDDASRPAAMTAPDGTRVQLAFDASGNITRQLDPLGRETVVEYDVLDRPVRTVRADGSEVRQGFDAAGNLVTRTDAAGNVTAMDYDGNGNLVAITTPLGATTRYQYDAEDRLLVAEDALGRLTTWQYNGAGQRTRKVYPDGTVAQWTYDAAGRLASTVDPDGDVTTYSHDLRGRVTGRRYADGSTDTFEWSADDQLLRAGNARGVTEYHYNAEGLVAGVTHPDGSSLAYEYDAAGHLVSLETRTSLTSPPRTTTYSHDNFGRLVGVEDPDGGVTSYAYDAAGNLARTSFPNGAGSEYDHDELNRLLEVRHFDSAGLVERYRYTLDALGNRTGILRLDGARVAYAYDAESRLLRESHFDSGGQKWHEVIYEYDAVGNRVRTRELDGKVTEYAYNDADQLLSRGTASYTFGPDGNLASRTEAGVTTHYQFDARNLLAQVQHPGFTVAYGYDARGQRVSRAINGVSAHYLLGVAPLQNPTQVLAEYQQGGAVLAENIFGNRLVSRRQDGTQAWAHIDGSLNTRLLTDATGTVSGQYDYDAFGNPLQVTGPAAQPYRFAGERHERPENLVHLRARDYDPQTGRLLSRDPFEGLVDMPLSRHRYQYGYQSPLGFTDPTGEFSLPVSLSTLSLIGLALGFGVAYLVDVKDSAKELKGKTDKFRAKFCRSGGIGFGLSVADQKVVIAESRSVERKEGPRSASYDMFALGAGWGIGTVGSNFGKEEVFTTKRVRAVNQFEGIGKLVIGGYSIGARGFGAAGVAGGGYILPEGTKIEQTWSLSGASKESFGTAGATAMYLTTFWNLIGEDDALWEGKLDCF